jgi:hypothetical protein
MYSVARSWSMTSTRFPDSETPGSKVVCTSPRLIAAYHVLHRFRTPRHPPCALISLTKKSANNEHVFRRPRCCIWARRCLFLYPLCSCQRANAVSSAGSRRKKLPIFAGGDNGDRTRNLRLAKPALSQLSYIPRSRAIPWAGGPR